MRRLLLAVMVTMVAQAAGWAETFNFFECYNTEVSERMPNTLDNLIGLVEKYEQTTTYGNMDELAEMIIHRYRKDGIIYVPNAAPHEWYQGDEIEEDKQKLIFDIIRPVKEFPADSFDPREECGLHFLVSHTTDIYPHEGVNDIWDGSINRNNRNKRSGIAQSAPSSSSSSSSMSSSSNARSSQLAADVTPAVHPIEGGVMETPYGPVAAGTLLAGIMSMNNNGEHSINSVLSDDTSYMPNEMSSKSISPVYAASLAGDLSQLALEFGSSDDNLLPVVGPTGLYHNCTTCAKLFSLENNIYSYLSRAELNAGLDVLILHAAYTSGSSSNYGETMSLSQLLRLYYSEKGLPGKPEVKACNRMQLYSMLDQDKIFEQALHFTYAYQHDFPTLQTEVEINKDNYPNIESYFSNMVKPAVQAMESFIGSYNYDDEGYAQCAYDSLGGFNRPNTDDIPPSEGMSDLIAIYAEEGSDDDLRDLRQIIGDVSRRIGVSTDRSRLGVMSGRSGQWLMPLNNITNIGDWACNFTSEDVYGSGGGGSRADMQGVFEELSTHYQEVYNHARQDLDLSSGRSQVVMWQVPASLSGDVNDLNRTVTEFRDSYPDVRIIFVGRNKDPYLFLLEDDDDFISHSSKTIDEVVAEAVNMIHISPRYFVYPACDPDISDLATDYREDSHNFEGYVYPNYTTYIKIPAQNFHYSETLEVKVTGDVRTCFSRTNRMALEEYYVENLNPYRDTTDDTIVCVGGPDDEEDDTVTMKWLCDRYVIECNPVYMSVTGLGSSNSRGSCSGSNSDAGCEFPNQIKYELTHKGMQCGCAALAPATALLAVLAVLQRLLN